MDVRVGRGWSVVALRVAHPVDVDAACVQVVCVAAHAAQVIALLERVLLEHHGDIDVGIREFDQFCDQVVAHQFVDVQVQ